MNDWKAVQISLTMPVFELDNFLVRLVEEVALWSEEFRNKDFESANRLGALDDGAS